MPELPTGTVAFLFTDVEGSTKLLQAHPDAYQRAVRRHHDLLAEAVCVNNGTVFETVGDAVYAAFQRPTDAVAAALWGQLALLSEQWDGAPIRVRMGLHLGEVEVQGEHYFGAPLYRCARLMGTAHGGQVVLSEAVAAVVRDAPPDGAALEDLGEHRLKDLARPERVYQLVHGELPREFPPLRSLESYPTNLPVQLTSFVGREQAMAQAKQLLETARLLTLTGTGGCGKTRLAMQVGADVVDGYADGVWLVELAALTDPALLDHTVAAALGVAEEPGRSVLAVLQQALRSKRLLLILDNCEHMVDACARFADALLHAGARIQILATSREALGIGGEVSWQVPSFPVPQPSRLPASGPALVAALNQYEAVRLFIDRAAAALPGFQVTNENAPAVAQICHRLDGIPLAIELAAARVRALPVEQIANRLGDRFRLLTGGSRTALPRQQTLQALVDWSYGLLSDQEKTLFGRLAVFKGGFTLEAAEAVGSGPYAVGTPRPVQTGGGELPAAYCLLPTEDVLDLLVQLVDKSLVVAEQQGGGVERYRLLETLRQYAMERLAASEEAVALRERHAAYFAERLAERRGVGSSGANLWRLWAEQERAWAEQEEENLRAALGWWEECDRGEAALHLVLALRGFWIRRGSTSEARDWYRRVLALPSAQGPSAVRADVLSVAGTSEFGHDHLASRALLEECRDIRSQLGDELGAAQSHFELGMVARYGGDYGTAQTAYEEHLRVGRRMQHGWMVSDALNALGLVALENGDFETAEGLFAESLGIRKQENYRWGICECLENLGRVAHYRGELERARSLHEQSLALAVEQENRGFAADSHIQLGLVATDLGRYAEAGGFLQQALTTYRDLASRKGQAVALEGFARLAAAEGRAERALQLAGAAAALWEAMQRPCPPSDRAALEQRLESARGALSPERAERAFAAGRGMTTEEAVAMALGVPASA